MCNRYRVKGNHELLAREFDLPSNPRFPLGQLELFPLRDAPVIRPFTDRPGREAALLRWGLVPSWAEDAKIGRTMTNARCETVATKPSFRSAFKSRRCLIPATSFCEHSKADRRWYEFGFDDGRLFAFAGLWEAWDKGDEPLETFTMLTGEPNELVAKYHDRMPVIVPPEDYELWLTGDRDDVDVLFRPFPDAGMTVAPLD